MKRIADFRQCPICDELECRLIHTARFVLPEGHPLPAQHDVVLCSRCGFIYADLPTSQAQFDCYYTDLSRYQDVVTSTGAGCSPSDRTRLAETAATISCMAGPNLESAADIGCANGGLLRSLLEQGVGRVCGIDPSPACVANARAIPGVEAHCGSLFSLPEGVGRFQCVALSHVLEHVRDLNQGVRQALRLADGGGALYVEVPDASRYVDYLEAPFQEFNTEHINHFSLTSLRNLVGKAGWTPIHSGTKLLPYVGTNSYPVVFGVFKEANGSETGRSVTPDRQLEGRIMAYTAASQQLLERIDIRLRSILVPGCEILVWGVGQLTMRLLAETTLADARIVAFVDGNPIVQGSCIAGRPILSPAEAVGLDCPILIGSLLHQEEILSAIRSLGIGNEVHLLVA